MIFANLSFMYLFLPLCIILYYLSKNIIYRNTVLVLFSLFFYAWGEPVMVWVLLASVLFDYALALLIQKNRGTLKGKLFVALAVTANLSVLGIFKYSGFIVSNLNGLLHTSIPVPQVALPIGISFYTFHMISYVVDIYREQAPAQKNPARFLMYVSMFHQLMAGPIVRYNHIADELSARHITATDVSRGISRFIVGLAKKVMIANAAGVFVAQYLDGDLSTLSVAGAWFGILMYTLQIYFDFSGYSDMAIGLGLMFGFHYHENFNYPYISTSVTDFWRRWHMSLSSFFRDYVYIPLGGNRKHQFFNIFVVWFLTGLWHGASWNFILWGLYFGVLLVIEKLVMLKVLQKVPKFFSWLYLMIIVVVGWALFYFTDISRLGQFMGAMFGLNANPLFDTALGITLSSNFLWIIVSAVCTLPIVPWVRKFLYDRLYEDSPVYTAISSVQVAVNVVLLAVCTMLLVGQSFNPFLYYRF